MTLPEVVDSLRDFLEAVAREHDRVMIGIDELDKMRTEAAAERFLNDIKGIFGIRNCYFLVSVSEEATLSGGLPRDLIRVTRTVIAEQNSTGLTELTTITKQTVLDELKRKTRAVAVAVRRTEPEPQTGQILLDVPPFAGHLRCGVSDLDLAWCVGLQTR